MPENTNQSPMLLQLYQQFMETLATSKLRSVHDAEETTTLTMSMRQPNDARPLIDPQKPLNLDLVVNSLNQKSNGTHSQSLVFAENDQKQKLPPKAMIDVSTEAPPTDGNVVISVHPTKGVKVPTPQEWEEYFNSDDQVADLSEKLRSISGSTDQVHAIINPAGDLEFKAMTANGQVRDLSSAEVNGLAGTVAGLVQAKLNAAPGVNAGIYTHPHDSTYVLETLATSNPQMKATPPALMPAPAKAAPMSHEDIKMAVDALNKAKLTVGKEEDEFLVATLSSDGMVTFQSSTPEGIKPLTPADLNLANNLARELAAQGKEGVVQLVDAMKRNDEKSLKSIAGIIRENAPTGSHNASQPSPR